MCVRYICEEHAGRVGALEAQLADCESINAELSEEVHIQREQIYTLEVTDGFQILHPNVSVIIQTSASFSNLSPNLTLQGQVESLGPAEQELGLCVEVSFCEPTSMLHSIFLKSGRLVTYRN